MSDPAIQAFLRRSGWAGAETVPLAGDASHRRYERVRKGPATAVLMVAPPEKGEDIRPFIQVALFLEGLGLGAPAIFASEPQLGFLLLEDLGDALFASVARDDPSREPELYAAAIDVLVHLHRAPLPDWCRDYDAALMADLGGLASDWYADGGETGANVRSALRTALDGLPAVSPVVALRDFHAENLIWRPDHAGLRAVGLIDFQDAMASHPAYDLVSLLEDARRDLGPGLRSAMMERYCRQSGHDPKALSHAMAILGAQRNLRILGVFARLCRRDGKPHYIDLIPRVWAHLMHDLEHPSLLDLRDTVLGALPEPTDRHLNRLRTLCSNRRPTD